MSSNDENEYFCDGITEEIINALAKIDSLKVTSRTSSFYFKNKEVPISDIAETLGVSTIIEGSVRLSGNVVRITAQLIQAEDDFHYWSETWDRELKNIFAVQDEISLLIAEKSREFLGHFELQDQLVLPQTVSITAYDYSLKAKYHKNKWTLEDNKLAQEYYQKSLEIDPSHVQSMVGLADVYSFLGMTGGLPFQEAWTMCNELIGKALELEPSNSEALYQKGHSAFFTEIDFAKAFEFGSKAIEQNPNYAEAQHFLSFLYVLSGNKEQAKKHLDLALSLDPLNQETLFFKAYFDYMTCNYKAAFDQLTACIEVNRGNIPAHAVMTLCLLKMGEYDRVVHYFDDFESEFVEAEKIGAIALAYAHMNDEQNTNKYLNFLLEHAKSPDGFAFDSYVFMMYAVTGEIDKAFEWIENGIKNKASLLMLRFPDPMVEVLRDDERYQVFHDQIYRTTISKSSKTVKKPLLDEVIAQEYRAKLLEHLSQNEPFLDAALTLRLLADQIKIHPNKLSWLINEMQEQNFNQFINNYRIEHFKKLAVNPDNKQFSILGLAYDSGFNSKTVFNSYFKKTTGQSPNAWIKAQ